MSWRRWVFALAVALSLGAFWAQQYALDRYDLNLPIPEWLWVQLAVGWTFLLAGLATHTRRPDTATGRWMIALGLIWIGRLVFTPPLIQWESIGLGVAFYGLLFVILYTFPSGRLSGWERWAIPIYLMVVAVLSYVDVALTDFYGWVVDNQVCCPSHLLLIEDNPELRNRLASYSAVGAALVFLAIVVSFLARWRRATTVGRRDVGPLVLVLLPLLLMMVLIPGINAFVDGFASFPLPDPAANRLTLYLQNGALVLVPVVIFWQLVGTRLSRAKVADLVRDLSDSGTPDELDSRLRTTLGDPETLLVFRREEDGDYVGVDGRSLSANVFNDKAVSPIGDRVSIVHDPAVDADLVSAAGNAARLAITNARLQAELKAQLIEVRESRLRLVTATDDARRRVERDLHDGAQQRLVALAATLSKAQENETTDNPVLRSLLADAAGEAQLAMEDLRNLARGVHPAILSQAGLGPAIATLADLSRIPISSEVSAERYSDAIEVTVYFVIAEAVSNANKHSEATQMDIVIQRRGGELTISVEDNGVGDADAQGSGLRGLRDRISALGGKFTVDSPIGKGTHISASVPPDTASGVT
jgi:signal transduction histidine kinase